MGYETQLIVGKDTGHSYASQKGNYFQVYAIVDMCKMGYDNVISRLSAHLGEKAEPVVYWYAPTGDGDTVITEDSYGDKPKPVPIKDVIAALEETMEQEKLAGEYAYRRFKWAYALLKAMEDDSEELSVLMYGY